MKLYLQIINRFDSTVVYMYNVNCIFLDTRIYMKNIYIALILLSICSSSNAASDAVTCLAKTIYWEARGEPIAGKIGVAGVVLNRVKNDKFPDTICEVVQQRKPKLQFSKYITKGSMVQSRDSWLASLELSKKIIKKEIVIPSTFKALYFDKKSSTIPKGLKLHATIGNHNFYL